MTAVSNVEKTFVSNMTASFAKMLSQEALEAAYQGKLEIARCINNRLDSKVPENAMVFMICLNPVVFITYKENGVWTEPEVLQDNTNAQLKGLYDQVSDDAKGFLSEIRDLSIACSMAAFTSYSLPFMLSPDKGESVTEKQKEVFITIQAKLRQALSNLTEIIDLTKEL